MSDTLSFQQIEMKPSFPHSSSALMCQNSNTTILTTPLPAAYPTASGGLY